MLKKFKEDFDNMRKTLRAEATTEVAFNKLTNDEKEKRLSSLKFVVINPERAEVPEVMDTFKEQYGEKTLKAEISKIKKNYADGKLDMFKLPQDARKPKKMGGLLEDDNERIGYASGSTDGSGGVYDDFEKSNRPFIRELAELQTADKPEKNRGEKAADFLFGDDLESYIESQINDKAKTARQMGFKDYPRSYYTNEIAAEVKEIEKNKNPLLETREIRNEGGSLLDNDMVMEEPATEQPMMEQPMMEQPMMEQPQEDMLPDDEMEDNLASIAWCKPSPYLLPSIGLPERSSIITIELSLMI